MSHIVIDARIIDGSTGVYVQRLLHFLHQEDLNDSYTTLVPSATTEKWRGAFPKFTVVTADQKNYTFAEQLSLLTLLWRLKPDLVHFTFPAQPLLWFGRSVTTIHDTTLIRFDNVDMNPVVYKIRKLIFNILMRTIIWRSKTVVVPTEFVRNDLISFAGRKYADKITVTLEAGDPSDDKPKEIHDLTDKQFLFFIGNAFPYKNIRRTIDAFAALKSSRPDLHLALAGKKDYFYEELEDYVGKQNIPDVHFLGRISDGEKRWAYQHAVAFVTASLSEGFHIPLLEAMYEDCPVISSNVSCLPEVAGDAALYFNPHSTDELVTVIASLLDNRQLHTDLVARGRVRVKQFSWQRMAEQTLEVYRKAL